MQYKRSKRPVSILALPASVFLLIIVLSTSCKNGSTGQIMTVKGPIPASKMGITLPHEHILVDFIGADSTGYHRWIKQDVVKRALPFLREIQAMGCETFIECTPMYVGRDPVVLQLLAEETGLNIITNTGFYGAQKNKFVPRRAYDLTAEQIAMEWIMEFRNGIENLDIRPGFIKIAVDRDSVLSPIQEKIVRAAGLTHLETGMVIKSHTGTDTPAFNQLAVLESMGVPASAFIWTHAQSGTLEGWIRAAKMGAWVSLDNIRSKNLDNHLENLIALREAGVLDRVLISHDSGWYRVGQENGGNYNGYTTIFEEFIPLLRENGFSEEEIENLLVRNPANAFSIRKPGG
jgi:phosphotriesterase-related protein